ncbi:unnamed protein product [Sphenostylis stenocarpa]|uniref:Uncharacterized protein n=1 Tax=Sphenostylis stenocarpa TaxID=92480 RepID=A0AA86VL79_9FABA|nr:unnamed protein product [Sphenostylis stenocarpa]
MELKHITGNNGNVNRTRRQKKISCSWLEFGNSIVDGFVLSSVRSEEACNARVQVLRQLHGNACTLLSVYH